MFSRRLGIVIFHDYTSHTRGRFHEYKYNCYKRAILKAWLDESSQKTNEGKNGIPNCQPRRCKSQNLRISSESRSIEARSSGQYQVARRKIPCVITKCRLENVGHTWLALLAAYLCKCGSFFFFSSCLARGFSATRYSVQRDGANSLGIKLDMFEFAHVDTARVVEKTESTSWLRNEFREFVSFEMMISLRSFKTTNGWQRRAKLILSKLVTIELLISYLCETLIAKCSMLKWYTFDISTRPRDLTIICKNKISRSHKSNVKRLCETVWNDSSGNCKLRLNYVHGIIEAFILFDNPYVPLFPLQKLQGKRCLRLLCSLALN